MFGLQNVRIKDESQNPTGTFKARGMSLAVSMARHFGVKELAVPSASNAAGALAAYAARAGIRAHLFMPKDSPRANIVECAAIGAGLRVPKAIGDFLILDAIRESHGIALSITDAEMIQAVREVGAAEGLFVAPESGACCAAAGKLARSGWIRPDEITVIFNTGTGIKYLECFTDQAQSSHRNGVG
jgi:threonine synthase